MFFSIASTELPIASVCELSRAINRLPFVSGLEAAKQVWANKGAVLLVREVRHEIGRLRALVFLVASHGKIASFS